MHKSLLALLLPLALLAFAPSVPAWTVINATNQCSGTNGAMMANGSTWQQDCAYGLCNNYGCNLANGGGFPILVANGGLAQNYNNTIAVGGTGACASGAYGCGSGSNPNQYMTMAQAGAVMAQLCAGSGVPSDGSIVYTFNGVPFIYGGKDGNVPQYDGQSALMAIIYDSSGNQIWSGTLQGDPQNGHNGNKGYVNTNSKGQLQSTWCNANSYNP